MEKIKTLKIHHFAFLPAIFLVFVFVFTTHVFAAYTPEEICPKEEVSCMLKTSASLISKSISVSLNKTLASISSTSDDIAFGWSIFTNELIDNSINSLSAHKQFADNLENNLTKGTLAYTNGILNLNDHITSTLASTLSNTKDLGLATTASVGDSLLGASNGISDGWGSFINTIIDNTKQSLTNTKDLAVSIWNNFTSILDTLKNGAGTFIATLRGPTSTTLTVVLPPSLVTTSITPKVVEQPTETSPVPTPTPTLTKVSTPTSSITQNITQQQRDIIINQYDPSILPRIQGIELALQNSISHNTNQTDRTYDSILNSITSVSNSITEEGILNQTTLRTPRISNGTLSGTTIIGLVESPGTLTINEPTTLNNNTSQVGAYTFSTGTGANTLNGNTEVSGSNTFKVGTGLTTLGGDLTVTGTNWTTTPTISGLATLTSGLTSNGTVTVQNNSNFIQSGSGTFSTGTGDILLNGATTANTFSSSGATITGGSISGTTIDNSTIGITTPVAGNFTSIGVATQGSGAFTTLTSSGNTTLATGASLTNTFGTGTGAINTFGNATGTNAINGTSTFGGNILASTGSINIGTSGTPFGTVYADNVTASNIYGTIVTGSTSSNDWTINSDNATVDTENMSLAFERGDITPNATLVWDATGKKFVFNGPLELASDIGTATFTSPGLITATSGITSNGVATFNNNISQVGAYTFSTGTGTVSLNGATTANTFSSSGATITGGTINNSTIGITTPVAGNFTTIGATTTGSGAFTTLNISGQLTSTLATGTSPFSVTSTTLNTNLNADLLDGQQGSYYAPASTSANYIQNQYASAQTADMWISGNINGSQLSITKSETQTAIKTIGIANTLTQTVGNSAHETIGTFNSTTYSGSENESSVYGIKNYTYLNTTGTVPYSYGDRTAVFNTGAVLTNGEGLEGNVINNSGTLTNGYGVVGNVQVLGGNFNKIIGVYSNITNASSDVTNGDPYGFYSSFHNTGVVDGFAGLQIDAYNTGTARIMNGLQVDFWTAGGTTQELRGIDIGVTHPWTGTPTNSYGIYIDASTNIGTSTNYSIYSASTANSYFAGNVGIGTTAPVDILHIFKTNATVYDGTVDDGQQGLGSGITITNQDETIGSFAQLNLQVSGASGRGEARIVGIRMGSATSDMAFVTENANVKAEKMRITSAGNVGIGTTNPDYKLTVNGANSLKLISSDSDKFIQFVTPSAGDQWHIGSINSGQDLNFAESGVADGRLYLKQGGNVGIGTTVPWGKLDVAGLTYLRASADGTEAEQLRFGRVDANYRYSSIYYTAGAGGANNNLQFRIHDGGGSPYLTQTTVMTLLGDGNVGIGTTNPSAKLEVVGENAYGIYNTQYTNAGYPITWGSRRANGTKSSPTIVTNGSILMELPSFPYNGTDFNLQTVNIYAKVNGTVTTSSIPTDIIFGTDANGSAYTSGNARMVITSAGNVGIGTTAPGQLLSLKGSAAELIEFQNTSGTPLGYIGQAYSADQIFAGTTLGDMVIRTENKNIHLGTNSNSAPAVTVQATTGNVGIGTTSPGTLLHLKSSAVGGTVLNIENTDTGGRNWSIYSNGTGNSGGAGSLQFYDNTAGLTRLFIKTDGNVGIGTTAPGSKMSVLGGLAVGDSTYSNIAAPTGGAIIQGRVGIGTTWPSYMLDVNGDAYLGGAANISKGIHIRNSGGFSQIISDTPGSAGSENPLQLGTYSQPGAVTIKQNGYVGIGTTNPLWRLSILDTAGNGNIEMGSDSNSTILQSFDRSTSVFKPFRIITSGTQGFYQDASGNVGIGTTNPAGYKLYINGTGYLNTAAWTYGSDRRLKENIYYFADGGLEKILQLKPAKFDYIAGEKGQLGFIAQDVQEVIPEAVVITNPTTGMLGLKTEFITPYLVKAIQELNLKVTDLSSLDTTKATSLGSLVKKFLADMGNNVTDLYASVIHSDKVQTKMLCVGTTCVTEDQFLEIVNKSGITTGTQEGDNNLTLEQIEAARVAKIAADLVTIKTSAGALTQANYTAESWATFQAALVEALKLSEDTEANKTDKTAAITSAIGGLVQAPTPSNLTAYNIALNAKIASDYNTDSWTAYQAVLDANVVTTANSQTEVDNATSKITAAQGSLTLKSS